MPDLKPTSTDTDSPSPAAVNATWQRRKHKATWRKYLSRRSLLDMLRTAAWLVPLTIIIWIYAERSQIIPSLDVDTSITVVSSDSTRFVEPAGGAPLTTVLTLSGPQASVEEVRQQLTNGIPRGVQIDIADILPPGRHQRINVVNSIENLPIFKVHGVTVTKSQPSQVVVNVDRIEEREVSVQVPPGVTNLSSVTFDPRKVHLRGPAAVLGHLESQGNLHVYADIEGLDVLRTPGKKDLPSVPLKLSQSDDGLTIEPPNVHASFDVNAANVTGTIDSMPIVIEALPSFLRSNDITPTNDTLANVRVVGPSEKIALLVDHQLPARAVLDVRSADQSTLKFELPDGVTAAPGQTERTVDYKVKPRDNSG